MEFKNTMARLMGLLEAKADSKDLYWHGTQDSRDALDRLIRAQVDRVKVNVMTYILDGMDFFNGKVL